MFSVDDKPANILKLVVGGGGNGGGVLVEGELVPTTTLHLSTTIGNNVFVLEFYCKM